MDSFYERVDENAMRIDDPGNRRNTDEVNLEADSIVISDQQQEYDDDEYESLEEEISFDGSYWKGRCFFVVLFLLISSFIVWSVSVLMGDRVRPGVWIGLVAQLIFIILFLQSFMRLTPPVIMIAATTSGYLLSGSVIDYYREDMHEFMPFNAESEVMAFFPVYGHKVSSLQRLQAIGFLTSVSVNVFILISCILKNVHTTLRSDTSTPAVASVKKLRFSNISVALVALQVAVWTASAFIVAYHSCGDRIPLVYPDEQFTFVFHVRWLWYWASSQLVSVVLVCFYCLSRMRNNVEIWRIPTIGFLILSTGLGLTVTNGLLYDWRHDVSCSMVVIVFNMLSIVANFTTIIHIGIKSPRTNTKVVVSRLSVGALLFCQFIAWGAHLAGTCWIQQLAGTTNYQITQRQKGVLGGDFMAIGLQGFLIIFSTISAFVSDERRWRLVIMAVAAISSQFVLQRSQVYFELFCPFLSMLDTVNATPAIVAASGAVGTVILNYVFLFIHGFPILRKVFFPTKNQDFSTPLVVSVGILQAT
eukprot:TRINITY_DN11014_c0_g1_i2.p1 TRINITY_DN11014_c0_g1~~TRINITY_DN11014_c0_g1_i2.p1  ORF type:complete len:531 (+),score=48.74 TRINITY_DN11014_c0_g1_i2:46-1638(+)